MNTRTKKYALPFIVVIAVLLAFSSPAAADYSGDHPLTIYEHGMINGSLVYETVTDGSAYTPLQAKPPLSPPSAEKPNLTQNITISIPEGATVKMARLYNPYCWSTSDWNDPAKFGLPAEADIWFEGQKATCQNPLSESCTGYFPPVECRDAIPNPIDYGNGVIQYWDTKDTQNTSSVSWDFPSGVFAWDVTDMVTGSGTYVAKIQNNDSSPTDGDGYNVWERFVTFGFGLLVVYEDPDSPEIEYWIAEGCDYLLPGYVDKEGNLDYDTITNTTFGSISKVGALANLTTVWTHSEGGEWGKNMHIFNGVEIGGTDGTNIQSIDVTYFDVTPLIRSDENVLEFEDRGDDSCVHNAFLVVGGEIIIVIPANVSIEPKTLILGTSGEFTATITLPDPYDVANIDISTVECGGAPALSGNIVDSTFVAEFRILDLVGVSVGDAVELTVTGKLTDGTPFVGNDTVSVKPLWESYSAIASGLGDVGERPTPAVFNMDGTWYLIAGESDGTFNGYNWNGTAWVSDPAMVSGLGNVGVQSTPAVFYKDEDATWYLISGRSAGDFVGYRWTDGAWISNDTIVSGLGTVVSGYTAPTVFCMDSTWYLISGNAYGRFDYGGRRWDAANSTWVEGSDIVLGLGDVGEDSTSTIFNADGTWYLISGAKDGTFTGYHWTGTVWKPDLAIVSGLEDIGENSAPAVFNMDETWYLISVNTGGTFNGFWQVTSIVIPASVTYDLKKVKLNSNGILKAFITLPEPYDVANIDIDTVECEEARVIGSKITGKGVLEAKFEIQKLNVSTGDEVRLTVTGELYDGTPFEGSNTLKVV